MTGTSVLQYLKRCPAALALVCEDKRGWQNISAEKLLKSLWEPKAKHGGQIRTPKAMLFTLSSSHRDL
jgi:hypothetical protein